MSGVRAWMMMIVTAMAILGCAAKAPPRGNEADALHYNLQLGYGYLENGQYRVALEKFERALELDRQSSEAYLGMAETYARLAQYEKADVNYRRAIALAKSAGAAHNNYGAFLCAQGKLRAAESEFLAAIADPAYSTPAFAYTNAAVCLRKLPDLSKARAYLDQATRVDPRFAPAWFELSSLAMEQGRTAMARDHLERYHQLAAPNRESLKLAYRIESALGNTETASRLAAQLKKDYGDDLFLP